MACRLMSVNPTRLGAEAGLELVMVTAGRGGYVAGAEVSLRAP